ncbi:xylulokinase [Microvirga aerophila]|uniref:Carbohydrate kinase n=1 Tax=Microvirga aerophila TaxID=670291 RepID=A0A512BMS8_9HYPH|nr:FGGY-family carbohydrate kinase [Microvirga aerophila]GEO13258.1 carbohydrate kinase [Microvirga aerophila]
MGHPVGDASETVLCCDMGGSSLRVGLVDRRGDVVATAACALTLTVDSHGQSEVDPNLWWQAFQDLVASLAADNPDLLRTVAGVSICGMTRTQVLVDEEGSAVRPAITWRDSRAGIEAADLAAAHDGESIDAFHPVARLAWIERHEPEIFAKARFVVDPKDYLAVKLTGRAASDKISLARLLAVTGGEGALSRFCSLLPQLVEPSAMIDHVGAGLPQPLDALAGCPVFMASNDTWTAVLGLGALRPGMAYNIVGTSEVLGLVSSRPAVAQGLMSVDWGLGFHQTGGPSQNGADVIPWLSRACGVDRQDMAVSFSGLLAGERHPQPVLFLPFLQGERVPYWDPDLRGAFLGLATGHGPTDLAWAVLEGAAFSARFVLERAEAAAGEPAKEIRFGGGGARSEAWCQVRADVMRRPVVVGACDEPGLLGCAAVAWTGLGDYASLAEAQETIARPSRRFEPRPDRVDDYDALYAVYKDAVPAAAPIAHRLATMRTAKGLAVPASSS